tara:strand:- start:1075 stop:1527 length:453 start_codon:yes stop_codon:yes gene_type:complete
MNWEEVLKRRRRIIPPVKAPKKTAPQDKFKYTTNVLSKKEIHEKFRKRMHDFAKTFIDSEFGYLVAQEIQRWERNIASMKKDPARFEKDIKRQEKHVENLKALTPEKLYSNALPLLNKEYDKFLDSKKEPHEYYQTFIVDIITDYAFGEP